MHTIDNPKKVLYWADPEEYNFTGVIIDIIGCIVYYVNGKRHRENGPAVIESDGSKQYWLNHEKLDISTDQELKDYLILRMFE